MNHVEDNDTEYQDLEYDLIFEDVLRHHKLFLESNFNVDMDSEYNCIVNYVKNEVK
jgi:hypothetical protein